MKKKTLKPAAKKHAKERKTPKVEPKMKAATESVVVTMVVDESGSMSGLAAATMAGFNEYVDSLKRANVDVKTYFSALTFDTRGIRKLQVGAPIETAIQLSQANYRPNGGTPLFDAIGSAIDATDKVMVQQKGTKAIVVIQTDGEENSSIKYRLEDIKAMIEGRQSTGWQFVFIGAGIDAFASGTRMGVLAMNTVSYGADEVHTRSMFASTAANTTAYSSGFAGSMNYSQAQSEAAGESSAILKKKMAAAKPQPVASAADPLSLTE
jgi:uncharacterized protein YegL